MVSIGSTGLALVLGSLIFLFAPRKWVTFDEELSPRLFGFMLLFFGAGLLIFGYYNSALDALI